MIRREFIICLCMNPLFCPYITFLFMFRWGGVHGQDIIFDNPHPVTSTELLNPLIPLVSENSRKEYFIRHVYSEQVKYGGVLPKKWLTIDSELLSFYKNTDLFHLDLQKQSAIIGTDTASRTTYYTNSRPQRSQFKGIFLAKSYQASQAKRISLPGGFDADDIHSFYLNPTWDVLIFSTQHKGGKGQEDLYISVSEEGVWKTPINLGASINTQGAEISPFLDISEKKLFFSSDGHDGYGQGDLFVAERLYDSWQVWSQPVNLGEKVNSSGYEAYLSIMDDSVAYFFSENSGQGELWTAGVTNTSKRIPFRLASDTRSYLEKGEVEAWLGVAIDTILSFVPDQFSLTRNSQELLWFVANQMMGAPDVHIHITFFPRTDDNSLATRSIVVRNYLMSLGIDKNRISTHELPNRKDLPEVEADAVFYLFRTK